MVARRGGRRADGTLRGLRRGPAFAPAPPGDPVSRLRGLAAGADLRRVVRSLGVVLDGRARRRAAAGAADRPAPPTRTQGPRRAGPPGDPGRRRRATPAP